MNDEFRKIIVYSRTLAKEARSVPHSKFPIAGYRQYWRDYRDIISDRSLRNLALEITDNVQNARDFIASSALQPRPLLFLAKLVQLVCENSVSGGE